MKKRFAIKKCFMMVSSMYAVGMLVGHVAYAGGLPSGGRVAAGSANIYQRGSTLNIDQNTDKAIIDWKSFSVGGDNTVNFNQPSSDSATLNRVTGDFTSQIAGRINANGSVFLVNPNGILITADGVVDTGNFVASTLDIDNNDFLNGDYTFTKSGSNGVVANRGTVAVDDGGFVALLGGAVKNGGTVRALVGKVGFAGGEKIVMSFGENDFLRVEVPTDTWDKLTDANGQKISATLDLDGTIESRGGFIDIAVADASDILRQTISIDGIVSANTVSSTDGVISISGGTLGITGNGRITADADYGNAGAINVNVQSLNMSAPISATAQAGDGGAVKISLQQGASLSWGAVFDVSGKQGGTLSLIGGLSGDTTYKVVGTSDFIADGRDEAGGYIDISNKNGLVGLFSGTVSARGALKGGRVRIGGAFQGGAYDPKTSALDDKTQNVFVGRWSDNSTLVRAGKTSLGTGVRVVVSSALGTGGTVILWADHTTNNYASIDATGAVGGGAVEISGKKKVDSFGLKRVEVGNGVILLDPKNVVISRFSDGFSQAKRIMSTTPLAGFKLDLDNNDHFGSAVAISEDGSKLAVGAIGDDTGASNNGAVYLFSVGGKGSRWGGALLQEHKIAYGSGLDVKSSSAQFGTSVAFNDDGSKLVVGMPFVDKASPYRSGSGRIFLFSVDWGKTVTKNAELEYGGEGYYGTGVALSDDGTKLAVGETHDNGGKKGGASYVYDAGSVSLYVLSGDGKHWGTSPYRWRTGRIFHRVGGLRLSAHDGFGYAVALSADGSTLAVGAVGDDTGAAQAGAVHMFRIGGTTWGKSVTHTAKIADGAGVLLNAKDAFGSAVALTDDGTKLAVGARYDDTGGENRGAVYLFHVHNKGTTVTEARKIGNGSGFVLSNIDKFGSAVALNADGSRLVVGASDNNTGGTNRGAVYLFGLSMATWGAMAEVHRLITHQQTLDFNDGKQGGSGGKRVPVYFGASVALSSDGTKLAVGATGYNAKGAVYLFEINDRASVWGYDVLYTRRISDGNGVSGLNGWGNFGQSVALSGDGTKLAVGAPGNNYSRGTLHLFTIGGSRWGNKVLETRKIGTGTAGLVLHASDNFGSSIALSEDGTKMAVGAYGDDAYDSRLMGTGAVYLFAVSGSKWGFNVRQNSKIYKNLSLVSYANFGQSVALNADGSKLAVGADGGNNGGTTGAVYLFLVDGSGDTWGSAAVRITTIVNGLGVTLHMNDAFGGSIALSNDGTKLAVGAYNDDTGGTNRGAVYLFALEGKRDLWGNRVTQAAKIAHNAGVYLSDNDEFGMAVAFNGDGSQLVVGLPYYAVNRVYPGAVYTFTVGGITWGSAVHQTDKVFAKQNLSLTDNEGFGSSVALSDDGTKLAVGAKFNDTGGTNRGAVYLFELSGGDTFGDSIYYTAKIAHGNGVSLSNIDRFGSSVALSKDGHKLVVGAPYDDTGGKDYGAVYLLNIGGSLWGKEVSQLSKLVSTTTGYFGESLALSGDGTKLAVGVPFNNTGGHNRGLVKLYTLNRSNTFTLSQTYGHNKGGTALSLHNDERFGTSVALSDNGSKLVVGALGYAHYRGKVYIFDVQKSNSDARWGTQIKLRRSIYDGIEGISLSVADYFGSSVALSNDGGRLVVGAYGDDTGGSSGDHPYGAVYVFDLRGDLVDAHPKIAQGAGMSFTQPGKFGWAVALTGDGRNLVVGAPATKGTFANEGGIYLLDLAEADAAVIEQKLQSGTYIKIVASNDITIDTDIITTKGMGRLSLVAGRSIIVNGDVKIRGGLAMTANTTADIKGYADNGDRHLLLKHRDAGKAHITVAKGKTLSGGVDAVRIKMLTGKSGGTVDKTQTGTITVWKVDGKRVSIVHWGTTTPTTDSQIIIQSGGQITATGDLDKGEVAIELAADIFTNRSHRSALTIDDTTGTKGRYLVWTKTPIDNTLSGIRNYSFNQFSKRYDIYGGDFQSNTTASSGYFKDNSGFVYKVNPDMSSGDSRLTITQTYNGGGSSGGTPAVTAATAGVVLLAAKLLTGNSDNAPERRFAVSSIDNIFNAGIYAYLSGIHMRAIYRPPLQTVFDTVRPSKLRYGVKYTATYDMVLLASNIKAQKVLPLYESDEKAYETLKRIFI